MRRLAEIIFYEFVAVASLPVETKKPAQFFWPFHGLGLTELGDTHAMFGAEAETTT